MAALQTTPESPATHLEPAEDGSECDADPEEEDEDEKGREEAEGEQAEEVVVEEEEVATQVQEVEVEASSEDSANADADADANSVEEVLAEEQSLSLGTQEQLSNGGDVKSPALRGEGKDKDPTAAGGRSRLGDHGAETGPGSEVWE